MTGRFTAEHWSIGNMLKMHEVGGRYGVGHSKKAIMWSHIWFLGVGNFQLISTFNSWRMSQNQTILKNKAGWPVVVPDISVMSWSTLPSSV